MSRSRVVVGTFDSGEGLLAAVSAARKAGLSVHDVYTPFPVHGMDEAMGLAPSKLPRFCFGFGAAGLLLTLAFQFWVSLFNWPMNIGGKSYDASPALVPIAFELTVLFAGLGTVATFLRLRRLFPGRRPFLAGSGGVDDRFVLALRLDSAKWKPEVIHDFLGTQGAAGIEEVEDRA
jgi:hypothetical protein